jgi:hypothetical protein
MSFIFMCIRRFWRFDYINQCYSPTKLFIKNFSVAYFLLESRFHNKRNNGACFHIFTAINYYSNFILVLKVGIAFRTTKKLKKNSSIIRRETRTLIKYLIPSARLVVSHTFFFAANLICIAITTMSLSL